MKKLLGIAALAGCLWAAEHVPAGSKVLIAPMENGLDGFIAPEIIKQKLPLVVVTDEKEADFVLVGNSIKADDKWYTCDCWMSRPSLVSYRMSLEEEAVSHTR